MADLPEKATVDARVVVSRICRSLKAALGGQGFVAGMDREADPLDDLGQLTTTDCQASKITLKGQNGRVRHLAGGLL